MNYYNFGSLSRWFDEEWIDVCALPKIKKCGRKKASGRNYPYCRPRRRINKSTPKTAYEISKAERDRRCKRKKKNPYKKIMPKRKKRKTRGKSPKRRAKRGRRRRRKSPKRRAKRVRRRRRKSPKRRRRKSPKRRRRVYY